jgi:hypothetical protein
MKARYLADLWVLVTCCILGIAQDPPYVHTVRLKSLAQLCALGPAVVPTYDDKGGAQLVGIKDLFHGFAELDRHEKLPKSFGVAFTGPFHHHVHFLLGHSQSFKRAFSLAQICLQVGRLPQLVQGESCFEGDPFSDFLSMM